MAHVFTTRRAQDDLESIWLHIAQDSPDAADRWLDLLYEKALTLAEQPNMGRARPELLPKQAPGLRSFPLNAYVIFYRKIPDGMELVRVLHSARDAGKALKGEVPSD